MEIKVAMKGIDSLAMKGNQSCNESERAKMY